MDSAKLLKYSLLAGALYFAAISVVHVLGVKIPGLFIYYNVPSHQYQDNIISFLAFGWAAFFYSGAHNLNIVKAILLAAVVALLGLANINISTNFSLLSEGISVTPFWLQFILLCFYIGWLALLSFKVQATK
ncbi:MAG: hypothetical protein OQK78_05860 [Gammaproteobacteria bacterium]|nr:hypothetical protein [Gammaproteobacteria bacterium]